MKAIRKAHCTGARFTADHLRNAARRLALAKAQKDLDCVYGMAAMVDDFEAVAIRDGLPEGAYEEFEKAHYAIGNALLELIPRVEELKAYDF